MKSFISLTAVVVVSAILLIPSQSLASEMVGIFALIDRVVMEPDTQAPERIQLWGVFSTDRNTTNPTKGYMYYKLPSSQVETARKEWADLKRSAGTGKVLSFGSRFFTVPGEADKYYATLARVRLAEEKPKNPDDYPLNFGVAPVTNPVIVEAFLKIQKSK